MSVWGKPLLIANQNLAAPLIFGSTINTAAGDYEYTGRAATMATKNYMPVDFSKWLYLHIAWTAGNMPTDTRLMVFAYNDNKEFLGRAVGLATNPRHLAETDFSYNVTSAIGPIAYIRVRLYNATFTAEQADTAQFRVYMSNDNNSPAPYMPRTIRYIS